MSFKEENYGKTFDDKHETVQSSFLEKKHLTIQKQLIFLFFVFFHHLD